MKHAVIVVFLIALIGGSVWTYGVVNENQAHLTAYVNADVISMEDEGIGESWTILVRDSVIEAAGPGGAVHTPLGAEVVDLEGKTVIPGLFDMHVHLVNEADYYPVMFLANGVTTVRDMCGRARLLSMREQAESGEILSPHLFLATRLIDGDPPVHAWAVVPEDPEEARQMVQRYSASGYDFIKVYERLQPDIYQAILEEASRIGIPVVGHVPNDVGMEAVLQGGQVSIEHLDGYFSDARYIEETVQSGIWNCPTLVTETREIKKIFNEMFEGREYLPVQAVELLAGDIPYRSTLNEKQEVLFDLYQAGANLLMGTDTGISYVIPGFSLHEELQLFVDAGIPEVDTLKIATLEAARFLGIEDQYGSIAPGKMADLVILNANPLEAIGNTRDIYGVMLGGELHPREELDEWLESLKGN